MKLEAGGMTPNLPNEIYKKITQHTQIENSGDSRGRELFPQHNQTELQKPSSDYILSYLKSP